VNLQTKCGNLTDDGANYEYVYDAFGRLREVNNTSNQNMVAEYKYNALGYRISVHQDTDTDGDVDASDKWYHFAYDENWQLVATYREDDTDPKEMFVNHNAGLDGNGGSSYIDNVILRERDANTSWMSASDGTLEERRYYCQNWRADVSVILASGGTLVEWVKYSPYGIPFGLPGADTDSDGDCDATDISNMNNPPGSYDVRYDIDLDGDNDATDKAIAQTYYQGTTYGWDTLSSNPDTGTGNRKGYAGYEYDSNIDMYHIRNRVLHPELGRWTRRDPLGYVDGMSVYEYVGGMAIQSYDFLGLSSSGGSCEDFLDDYNGYGIPSLWQYQTPAEKICAWADMTIEIECCSTNEGFEGLCSDQGPNAGACAVTKRRKNKVIICICHNNGSPLSNPNTGESCNFEDDLAHELIHAYQICSVNTRWYYWSEHGKPPVKEKYRNRSFGRLCGEIGAYANSPNSRIKGPQDCGKLCNWYGNFEYPNLATCVRECETNWDKCSKWAPYLTTPPK